MHIPISKKPPHRCCVPRASNLRSSVTQMRVSTETMEYGFIPASAGPLDGGVINKLPRGWPRVAGVVSTGWGKSERFHCKCSEPLPPSVVCCSIKDSTHVVTGSVLEIGWKRGTSGVQCGPTRKSRLMWLIGTGNSSPATEATRRKV